MVHNTNSVLSILRIKAMLQRAIAAAVAAAAAALHANAENTKLYETGNSEAKLYRQATNKQHIYREIWNFCLCAFVYAYTPRLLSERMRQSLYLNQYG